MHSNMVTSTATINQASIAVGGKVNPVGRLLITANVLFRVNDAACTQDPVPLIGVSYSFKGFQAIAARRAMPTYSDAMKKFTKQPRPYWTVGSAAGVCPERLWETRGSRLPLRGVIRLRIGLGSLWNLDGPWRRRPTGRRD
jgi:hypothetical protein